MKTTILVTEEKDSGSRTARAFRDEKNIQTPCLLLVLSRSLAINNPEGGSPSCVRLDNQPGRGMARQHWAQILRGLDHDLLDRDLQARVFDVDRQLHGQKAIFVAAL